MNEAEKQEIISELKDFYKELRSYDRRQSRRRKTEFSEAQERSLDDLRLKLQREHGRLAGIISKYGGEAVLPYLGREYEVFSLALGSLDMELNEFTALDGAISMVNKAIGKLESITLAESQPSDVIPTKNKETTKELELILDGTPDMILEYIRSTVERLNSQGYTYGFRRTSGAPDFAKWDKTYFASCAISKGDEGQIGTIKLQLLPKEKTSFKSLEPKDRTSPFGYFLNQLFIEFRQSGFEETTVQKTWRWLKSHKVLSTVGTVLIILITLLGTNWDTVVSNWSKCISFIRSNF
jgi:hypothetical protein